MLDWVSFTDMGTCEVHGWVGTSGSIPPAILREGRIFGRRSRRTSNQWGASCYRVDSTSKEEWFQKKQEGFGVTKLRRGLEMWEEYRIIVRWWQDYSVWYGRGLRCCNFGWCGVVVISRDLLVVCKIIAEDCDGTSKHEEWLEGGRQIATKERIVWCWRISFTSLFTCSLV